MAEYLRGKGSRTQGSKTSQIRIKNNKQQQITKSIAGGPAV